MPGCRVAIVADDLTGALDAAAPFARLGASTRVVISLEHLGEALTTWAADVPDVVAVNTESRHLSAEQAASRVAEAIETLRPLTPLVLFKKIDSTLRGQVVAECLAARRAGGRRLLIAPAVPAQGRVVRGGRVFVHGEPLEDSSFSQDAGSAPSGGSLKTLFAAQGLDVAIPPARSYTCLAERDAIADAEHDTDLDTLAAQLLKAPSAWLLVGAAGLASALARALFTGAGARCAERFDHVLFAVGSRSSQAQRQIVYLIEASPELPIVHVLNDTVPAVAADKSVLLIPGASSLFTARQVACKMAEAVAAAMPHGPANHRLLFLTGGDTAMAVMQRLKARTIEVVDEWEPGVAYGWLNGDRSQSVMTKAGGFGDETLLVRLLQALRRENNDRNVARSPGSD